MLRAYRCVGAVPLGLGNDITIKKESDVEKKVSTGSDARRRRVHVLDRSNKFHSRIRLRKHKR
jgi:hypothetical protein